MAERTPRKKTRRKTRKRKRELGEVAERPQTTGGGRRPDRLVTFRGTAGGWLKKSGQAASKWSGTARTRIKDASAKASPHVKKYGNLIFREYPARAWRRYRDIPSVQARRAIALAAVLLVLILAAFLLWPGGDGRTQSGKVLCEFLARPAAELHINDQLARAEIPPIYRVELEPGEYKIVFVSPDKREHQAQLEVVEGKPVHWFMDFVEGRMNVRPPLTVEVAQ